MKSHLQPATPSLPDIVKIPAPMREAVADARMFPRKNMEIRRLVSDFLYQVDIVYSDPDHWIQSTN